VARITEHWNYPGYGTSGRGGWAKGTSSWFSAGELVWASVDGSWLRENISTPDDTCINEAMWAIAGTYNEQTHYISACNNDAFYTRICTVGSESLWTCLSASFEEGSVAVSIHKGVDNTTGALTALARTKLAPGVGYTNACCRTYYQSGTWIVDLRCWVGNIKVEESVRYAETGFIPGNIRPAIALQCLGGTTCLTSSSWTYTGGVEPRLTIADYDIGHPNLPSSITFTGQPGLISRPRSLEGDIHPHAGRLVVRCDMTWQYATDVFADYLRWFSLTSPYLDEGVQIGCAWGTQFFTYIPGSFTSTHIMTNTNTMSMSFYGGAL
jgi:hypothetical protein